MARSFSNLRYNLFLDVSLLPPQPDKDEVFISITSPNFPNEKIIEFIKSEDQQLIDFKDLIEEFISSNALVEDKILVAKSLESMAMKIRKSIK